MKHSLSVGFNFGVTSGVITTLGLMIGLHSGTHSKLVVIGGILTIAVADAASDALGIHISEESENQHTHKQIWIATLATFFSKLIFTLTFLMPVLLFKLSLAIPVSIGWGVLLIIILSYRLARKQQISPLGVIGEHLTIMVLVIIITHNIGRWVLAICG